ncbi:hypothetical protein HGRIS_000878 [Hohenbuehelia grisea]|uniref:Deoxyribonuclease NucA/NucB domain-containing protein n=1 Tax=Hohenbuehelia grisea TaxID=104357 RepID=A0ABR3IQ07_9AGAR
MLFLSFVSLAALFGGITSATPATTSHVFTFDCEAAKGPCDTHCFARFCGDLDYTTKGFHFDGTYTKSRPRKGSKGTVADYRGAAIGCGVRNPCESLGLSCDEVPYASTYDGGLGCFAQGKTGVYYSGTIHCVPVGEHAAFNKLLTTFYESARLRDGDKL